MLGLGHEVFAADGATFVRNRDLPDIWEANHLTAVTAASPRKIDRLLARVEREYALENWRESARRRGVAPDDGIGEGPARSHRGRCPPARCWLAWDGHGPRAYLTSWEGIDGVGQVDDLFVEPGARGRGLAAALIRCGVTQCRAAGAGPVVIVADAADTPKDAYARMGFGPVAVLHEYLLQVRAESH